MSIMASELIFKKSLGISDSNAADNGRRISNDSTDSYYFANISGTERLSGVTHYRKVFLKNINRLVSNRKNLPLTSAKVWLKRPTPAGNPYGAQEYAMLDTGTDTDVQSDVQGQGNWVGVGWLEQNYTAGDTYLYVRMERGSATPFFMDGGAYFIGNYDESGAIVAGQFFIPTGIDYPEANQVARIAGTAVTTLGNSYNAAVTGSTITNADIFGTTYVGKIGSGWGTDVFKNRQIYLSGGTGVGQVRKITGNTSDTISVDYPFYPVPDATTDFRVIHTYVAKTLSLGTITCAHGTVVVTSATGTFNSSEFYDHPLGAVTDSWVISFAGSPVRYTVTGNYYGAVVSGVLATDISVNGIKPSNTGSGGYYFEMAAAGFGGSWAAGNTIAFTTTNSAKAFWIRQTVEANIGPHTANTIELMASGESA